MNPGTRLAHYEILSAIGRGGMGEVWKARDTKLGREVAIKTLPTEFAQDADRLARFEREAKLLASLNHPNIGAIFSLEESDGIHFLVLELVDGDTLAERLRSGAVPFAEALELARQIGEALRAAHAQGVIHRDLKPANIKVRRDGTVKLLDFGLAKTLEVTEPPDSAEASTMAFSETVSGVILGTPAYMSPEQALGRELDERTDVFSLGSVLYEATTGVPAFQATSLAHTLHEITTAHPPQPTSIRSDLPTRWDTIIQRALAKEPDTRYQTVEDLLQDIDSLRDGPASHASRGDSEPDPVFGRDDELEHLNTFLSQAVAGNGRLALVTGEPGIGKTALTGAFVFSARRRHERLLVGRGACVEQYGTGAAYLPFLEALGGLLEGPGSQRVVALLRRHAPTWCLQFPAVFSGESIEQLQREVIGATKDRLLRELSAALGALTAEFPVLLFLEDLHWADPASIDLLRHLIQNATGQCLLILGTARPEEMERGNHPLKSCKTELQARGACTEIPLRTLAHTDIATYLDVRFAPNEFPPELVDLIHAKTEGHPLFATGAIQLLVERGDILQRNEHWELRKPLSDTALDVPETVRSMIEKKVGVLGEEDARLLRYASIEGEEFVSSVLAAIAEIDELDLEEQLERIERTHGLLRAEEEIELPDGSLATRYRFAHALYQNFLYGELLTKRRSLLHRRAGVTLERIYGNRTADIAPKLAAHFERGRDFSRALTHFAKAGEVSRNRYAYQEAVAHYSHALNLTEKLEASERDKLRAGLFHQRALSHMALGSLQDSGADYQEMLTACQMAGNREGECRAHLGLGAVAHHGRDVPALKEHARKAYELANQIGDPKLVAEAINMEGFYMTVTGCVAEAQRNYEQGLRLARSVGHRAAVVYGLTFRGVAHFFQSEYAEAEAAELEASRLAAENRDGIHLPLSLYYLGLTRANQGRISEALSAMQEAWDLASRNQNRVALSRIPNGIGWVWREVGNLKRAVEYNEGNVEVARQAGAVEGEANSLINLIYDYTLGGDLGAAERAIDQVNPLYDGREPWNRWRFYDVRHQAAAAEFWLRRHGLEQAEAHARTLLENSRRYGVPKYVSVAHRLLGEIAMHLGDANTAEEELNRSLEPFETHPAPLTEWRNRLALGRLLSGRNRPAAAMKAFSEAAELIKVIAGGIADSSIREQFLATDDVREVLAGAKPAEGGGTLS